MTARRNPLSMEHFFFLCRQLMDEYSLNVAYENLLHHYSVHPSQWEITNTFVKERSVALWDGVYKMGWIIYTDASVSSYGAGCAFTVFHHGFCIKTQGYALTKCSIFSAESQAVLYAVQYLKSVEGLRKKESVEIRCDSQAVIVALERTIITDPMLKDVKDELRKAKQKGVNILLRWVPSHAGIEGNELADKCAKTAIDSCVIRNAVLVKRDLRSCINKKVYENSAKQWTNCGPRIPKLFFPEASDFVSFLKSSPLVDLCQLVLGHCRLNEFMCNKMAVINSPICACNEENETVSHFLLFCPFYDQIRREIWCNFEPTFEFVSKDWKKVDDFIKRTKRFI